MEARSTRRRPEAIQATVRAHFPAMRACYERGLARDPAYRLVTFGVRESTEYRSLRSRPA